jgi:hypothetical protein
MYSRTRRALSAVPDPEKVRKGKGAWAKGNSRVTSVMTTLSAFGYRVIKSSVSGRSSKRSVAENRIAGDFLAMAPQGAGLPHLIVEVGGKGKSIAGEIRKMGEMPAGTAPLVVLFLDGKRWYYLNSDERFRKADEALDTLRSGDTAPWIAADAA